MLEKHKNINVFLSKVTYAKPSIDNVQVKLHKLNDISKCIIIQKSKQIYRHISF